MMFLMAIGVSTLAAAFANAGFIMRQSDYSRVNLLHESIHDNIRHSLQISQPHTNSLGFQIVMAILQANDPEHPNFVPPPVSPPGEPDQPNPGLGNLNLAVSIGTSPTDTTPIPIADFGGLVTVRSITLSFPLQEVDIQPAIAEVYPYPNPLPPGTDLITYPQPRVPRTAELKNASMIVEVEIRSGDRTITSRAEYAYSGGFFIEENSLTTDMIFETPNGYGTWRMIGHEIVNR
jgi:hypothetical protein